MVSAGDIGQPGSAPGFFGKLRSHGDFVGRRLPPEMREPLDAWLQAALLRSQADLGAGWRPAWLSSPLWRFILAPGVCGPHSWTGVMMPSLDRVGRCFPLLLASSLARAPSPADCMATYAPWFVRLEDLALSSLDDGFSLDAFDAALAVMEGAPPPADLSSPPLPRQPEGSSGIVLAGAPAGAAVDGQSAWWTDGSLQVAPCLALCEGLPAPAAFAAFLDGGWDERGWRS